jgi:hypothetical protein
MSPASAACQRIQPLPMGRRSLSLEVAKLFVGENYRFLTSTEELAVGVPVGGRFLLTARQGLTYATAGTRTSSIQVSNLLLGFVAGRGSNRGEVTVGLPLTNSFGDSDYANQLALFSGLDYRERYVHRWSVGAAVSHSVDLPDHSRVGIEVGGLALSATGENPAQAVARYGAFVVLPLGVGAAADLRFHGTAHVTGQYASFSDRIQNGATISLSFDGAAPLRGLFLYLPLDEGTRTYVNAVAGVRLRI